MIMQLVKSVADFSNVIYLLGYDESIVSAYLSYPSVDEREYLQKIINMQIALPRNICIMQSMKGLEKNLINQENM